MSNKASKILMIRPVRFGYNEQTAESNSFQNVAQQSEAEAIQQKALEEFDAFVKKLKEAGIDVIVFQDTVEPHTPDSIFPNNWISFHESGKLVLYPMLADNRRLERRKDIIEHFRENYPNLMDLSPAEQKNIILEGTGSILFDYDHKVVYANVSPRTNKELLEKLCKNLGYKCIAFKAVDQNGADIYHTNVLLTIGKGFAVICKDSIRDKAELNLVLNLLITTGHEIIDISYGQMNSFAGNMYQLFNKKGESFLVMSEQAFKSLNPGQLKQIEKHAKPLYAPLYTIEKHGGGSARCMIADVRKTTKEKGDWNDAMEFGIEVGAEFLWDLL